jgi:hypothetical protein
MKSALLFTRSFLLTALFALPAIPQAATFRDDFNTGVGSWEAGPAWYALGSGAGATLTVDTPSDEFAWNISFGLLNSWVIETEFTFESLYNDGNWTGTAGIALANSQNQLLYLADVIHSQDLYLYPGMGYYDGTWHDTLDPNVWHPNTQGTVKLRLERPAGSDQLRYTVTCDNGFRQEYVSSPIPAFILNQVSRFGLRGFKSKVSFQYVEVTTPLPATLDIAMVPGLTLRGEPGTSFEIQHAFAVEATEWTTLTNLTLQSNTLTWFDMSATNSTRRFYRALEQ